MSQKAAQPENEQRIHPLLKRPNQLAEAPSFGEILLPFLFAAMEACWIDAILIGVAGFDLFQTHSPLMPLWSPFVLLLGTQLILTLLAQQTVNTQPPSSADEGSNGTKNTLPGSPLLILSVILLLLLIIWSSLYSQVTFFFDPRWLFALLNDVLLFNQQAYHFFSIVALSLYLCWRSVRLLYREYEPSHVFGELRLGMGVIIVAILARAGQNNAQIPLDNELFLLLLVPIFLFLSLAAHALARISFVRHNHPVGLQGDVRIQERSVLMTIGIVGATLFIISWLLGTTASSAILVDTQQAASFIGQLYDVLIRIVASVIVFLVTPIFWLFSWWFSLFPPQQPHVTIPKSRVGENKELCNLTRTLSPPSLPHS